MMSSKDRTAVLSWGKEVSYIVAGKSMFSEERNLIVEKAGEELGTLPKREVRQGMRTTEQATERKEQRKRKEEQQRALPMEAGQVRHTS